MQLVTWMGVVSENAHKAPMHHAITLLGDVAPLSAVTVGSQHLVLRHLDVIHFLFLFQSVGLVCA
jgi:hypothetical protein